jgi:hypothetical protein
MLGTDCFLCCFGKASDGNLQSSVSPLQRLVNSKQNKAEGRRKQLYSAIQHHLIPLRLTFSV